MLAAVPARLPDRQHRPRPARSRDADGRDRYAIIDYKTNWLAPAGEPLSRLRTTGRRRSRVEMQRSHYVLQALLYSVALHRYLRWRLPGYDPASDLAGVHYLFLRGMLGPGRRESSRRRRRVRLASAGRADRRAQRPARPAEVSDERDRGSARAEPLALDPFAAELALRAPEPLAEFNRAGVLLAADVHVALTLGRVAGVSDPRSCAASRWRSRPRVQGHVFVELESADAELMRASAALVGSTDGSDRDQTRPLRLSGTRLYLDRYWREERRLAASLLARNRMRTDVGDLAVLGEEIAAAVRRRGVRRAAHRRRGRAAPRPHRDRRRPRHRQDHDRRADRRADADARGAAARCRRR